MSSFSAPLNLLDLPTELLLAIAEEVSAVSTASLMALSGINHLMHALVSRILNRLKAFYLIGLYLDQRSLNQLALTSKALNNTLVPIVSEYRLVSNRRTLRKWRFNATKSTKNTQGSARVLHERNRQRMLELTRGAPRSPWAISAMLRIEDGGGVVERPWLHSAQSYLRTEEGSDLKEWFEVRDYVAQYRQFYSEG